MCASELRSRAILAVRFTVRLHYSASNHSAGSRGVCAKKSMHVAHVHLAVPHMPIRVTCLAHFDACAHMTY